jgi:hypothetical protein
MPMPAASHAEEELRYVAQQFTQWRQRRTSSRGRIPPPLWAQAVALTQQKAYDSERFLSLTRMPCTLDDRDVCGPGRSLSIHMCSWLVTRHTPPSTAKRGRTAEGSPRLLQRY